MLLLLFTACRATPVLSEGLGWVETADDDPLQWKRAGFIELVTPIRPPTSVDRTARIAVMMRPPSGTSLRTRREADGVPSVVMAPGTVAVRVEYAGSTDADAAISAGWHVLDVRQFTWTQSGLRCTVLRPAPRGKLAGVEWRCGADADVRAGAELARLIRERQLLGPADALQRAEAGGRLAKLNGCTACHVPGRMEDRRPAALVQRAADGDGLFTVRSLWSDADPVERYRPVDPNSADPFLSPSCPGGTPAAGTCADGTRPRQRLAVAQGLAANDPHVARVCASRQALAARLDAEGAQVVRDVVESCTR